MDHVVALSRELINKGSKSFALAARLFPSRMRDDAYMLYAWCRHCDDVIDGQELGHRTGSTARNREQMQVALAQLERETTDALNGRPCSHAFMALARVVRQHEIAHRHPFDLLEGFRMDVDGRSYQTPADLLSYCYHVAGVVGVMMAQVMGVRDRETLERAQDLGIAFQLTNISRDIVEDAAAGRRYLPAAWLADEGIEPEHVAAESNRTALAAVARRMLDLADAYYDSASCGLGALPLRAAWAVGAARSVYRDIGGLVRQRGPSAWDTRAVVGTERKLLAIAGGLSRAIVSRPALSIGTVPPRDPSLWTKAGLADG